MNGLALFGLGIAAALGLGVAAGAADEAMRIHAMLFAGAAIIAVFFLINRIYEPKAVSYTHLTLPTNREV